MTTMPDITTDADRWGFLTGCKFARETRGWLRPRRRWDGIGRSTVLPWWRP